MTDSINLQDVCSKQVRPFRFTVELYNTGRGGDGDEGPVIIQFRTLRYRYNNNNNNNNKSRSGSLFYLRERPAHLVGINVVEDGNASKKRSIFKAVKRSPATATTKKTNRNNNNNDDDCNTTDSIDLQDEKHREIKKSMRFKTRTDKEKSNRLSTGSLTTRITTTMMMMMIVIRPIRSTYRMYV